jgi:hypothetical protein
MPNVADFTVLRVHLEMTSNAACVFITLCMTYYKVLCGCESGVFTIVL